MKNIPVEQEVKANLSDSYSLENHDYRFDAAKSGLCASQGAASEQPSVAAKINWWDWVEAHWKSLSLLGGGVFFYFAYVGGSVFQQTYLGVFAINEEQFPKDKFQYLMSAELATLKNFNTFLESLLDSNALLFVGKLILALSACGFFSAKLSNFMEWFFAKYPSKSRWSKHKDVKLAFICFVLIPLGVSYVLIILPLVVDFFMLFPVFLGNSAAQKMALEDLTAYKAGCTAHVRGKHCVRLLDGSKDLANGFIITQSKDNVALWDQGIVKVMPMAGRSLESYDSIGFEVK